MHAFDIALVLAGVENLLALLAAIFLLHRCFDLAALLGKRHGQLLSDTYQWNIE